MLAMARRDEGRQPDIETNFTACGWQRFLANGAGEDRVPLSGFAAAVGEAHLLCADIVLCRHHALVGASCPVASLCTIYCGSGSGRGCPSRSARCLTCAKSCRAIGTPISCALVPARALATWRAISASWLGTGTSLLGVIRAFELTHLG